jgi:queuine/archaeosine tRNA-ribosyltransferase
MKLIDALKNYFSNLVSVHKVSDTTLAKPENVGFTTSEMSNFRASITQ